MKLLKIELPQHYQDYGLLIIRLVFGFSMIYGHGFGKMQRLFGADEIKFADPFGLGPATSLALAVFAEIVCSVLIMLGLFTRAALIPLFITMLTAFFNSHLSDDFGRQEKAILYGFVFLALFLTGPGKQSLDHYLSQSKNQ